MHRRILWFAVFVAALDASAQDARLELRDYYGIESADEPSISPDGRMVAFTRHYIVEEDNRRRSEIWLAPVDGSAPARRITVPAFDASAPRFSTDGKLLTFRSERAGETSTWFLRTEGPGEAFEIPGVEGEALVSPDGRLIAFTKKTPPEAPAPEPSAFEKELEERFEGEVYDWMQFRYDRRGYLPDPTDPYQSPPRELYVVSVEGGEPKKLTSLGVDVFDFSWSADSERLVFSADAHQRDEYTYERADLWLTDLNGNVERLTDDGFHHTTPAFSPDGTRIAYRRMKGLSLVIAEKAERGAPVDVYVMDLASREATNVTATWDLRPGGPVWSADGGLYFDAGIGGNRHLFLAAAGSVRQVTEGDRWLTGFSFTPDGKRMAFAVATATSPSDVYVAASDGSTERKLSRFGEDYADRFVLSPPERIKFPSKDGTEIEGWVLLPAGYRAEQAWPLVLSIHGGPHGAYGNRFNFQFQLWASAGYVVLYTNPRGSSGYGEDFLFATWGGGWGNLDTEDVLAGVDYVRSQYSIDERRMGVTGYSYGGFLTNWIITHDTRFAAAIVGAGISNWVSDYGTADIPRTKESEFYGPPWEDQGGTLLQRQSPINYVQHVVTPTLFIHGESDFRVPIEQGEQIYTALKKRRVPAKFIRYPDSYHGGWTPWNMVHRYHHELEWWKELASPSATAEDEGAPRFELYQPELFAEEGSHTNAWADFDGDGDLDLFVGFGGNPSRPNSLYRNDGGKFVDVAASVGLADEEQTRAVGWGDYDGDGHLDLYVGFSGGSTSGPSIIGNRLYRNDGAGKHFTDVTKVVGVELPGGGVSRQISWVDYDNDGDVDLFVAFRDRADVLFRNDGGKFADVSKPMGIGTSPASMGAVWFDYDEDGDLDMYLTNMDGHPNVLYRNEGTGFVDVARDLGLDSGGREIAEEPGFHKPGSMRPDLIDYDNDGDLDIYVTNYGTVDGLYRNDGEGRFVNVAEKVGLTGDGYRSTAAWADYDNDGRIDVYVFGTLYRNEGHRFTDVTPSVMRENGGSYGVQWADFDRDGDVDLAFSQQNHYLFRNLLLEEPSEPGGPSENARRSLSVMVLDAKGHHTRAGSEIRLFAAGTRRLLGTRTVETGSGYCSQNAMPVHFGLGNERLVDIEITTMTRAGRSLARLSKIDPRTWSGRSVVVKVDADGQLVE